MARKAKLNPALSTLYNAPDVRENRRLRGGISEVETDLIDVSGRLEDRLALDVSDLMASIARNGQRVPILLRPVGDRYQLIYGRRRLEACRQLGRPVRAIVTDLEADQALTDQLLENQARRDLSFIERALVAKALLDGDHLPEASRTNKGVAEVLNLTEAGVSQMLNVVRVVGPDLIRAIGPAPGIGRPRWEELKRAVADGVSDTLLETAAAVPPAADTEVSARSDQVFLAVLAEALRLAKPQDTRPAPTRSDDQVIIAGVGTATVKTASKGTRLKLELQTKEKAFVSWLEAQAPQLIEELHARWKRAED